MITFMLLMGATISAALDASPATRLDPELRCHLGVYMLPSQKTFTLTGDGGQSRAFQYVLESSRIGHLRETERGVFSDGELSLKIGSCADDNIQIIRNGKTVHAKSLALKQRDTKFFSEGLSLHGKLVMPPNRRATALAVWIEGSNNNPSTDDNVWQYELARRGVAVFVYDKRGTGASEGMPSSDFYVRARDTAAAVATARKLAPHIRQVGVIGGSQGGWVAPLTATLTDLDFVIPAFAMAESPIAQDRELVQMQLRKAGYGETEQKLARSLTSITEHIVRSNLTEGFSELEAFKAEHGNETWLKAIEPRSYTGLFLLYSSDEIKTNGPALAQGLRFDFEPLPIISSIKPRQLWLLAGADQQAPNIQTREILAQAQRSGQNINVVVFEQAGHGLVQPANDRQIPAMRYAEGVFDKTANWISTGKLSY